MNGTQLAIILIAAALLLGLAAFWQSGRTSPAARRRTQPLQSSEGMIFNTSFRLAVAAGLLIGFIVAMLATPFLPLLAKGVVAVTIAALYVLWVYHKTPTNNKTAVLFLKGGARVRMGPNGKGFNEGLNAMPLGWPFFIAEDKSTSQTNEEFRQMKAYSKDKQPVFLEGTFNLFIDDIYATYNIENIEEAKETVRATVLKWLRAVPENYNAKDLVEHDTNGNPMKNVLAREAYTHTQAELSSRNPIGYNVRPTINIVEISLDADFEKALKNIAREEVEGQHEEVQVRRRLEQLAKVKAEGVNPDMAAAFVQVEAEKPGAKINTINIPGMQGIGEAAGNAGKAFSEWLRNRTT